jgi:hypothetical protein
MATKFQLEAKQAQGEDVSEKLADELKKLQKNIDTDKESSGQPSTDVDFDAVISGGGNGNKRSIAVVARQVRNGNASDSESDEGDLTDGDLTDGDETEGDLTDDEFDA